MKAKRCGVDLLAVIDAVERTNGLAIAQETRSGWCAGWVHRAGWPALLDRRLPLHL